jgi:hypothetical protein
MATDDPKPARISESERQLIQLTAATTLTLQALAVQIAEIDRLHERCQRLGIKPQLEHLDLWGSWGDADKYLKDLLTDFVS